MRGQSRGQTAELIALAREGHIATFVDRAVTLAAADLADVLVELPVDARIRLTRELPAAVVARALVHLPADVPIQSVLVPGETLRAAEVVAQLPDDDAARLLLRLPSPSQQAILASLPDRAALERILAQTPRSAGAIMRSRVITVSELDTMALAVEEVRRQAAAAGNNFAEIFVIDTARRLSGILTMRDLLLASGPTLVRDVMTHGVVHVGPGEDQSVVARVLVRYNLSSIAVVDGTGHVIGQVTADDVRGVVVDEASEDLLRFGGVSSREAFDARWTIAVRSRLPWLYANLIPAFGAAAVVLFFKGTIVRVVSLAIWMPVVAGVGGNAGTQALAASVRRLVLHPERGHRLRAMVGREALIGVLNGLAIGAAVAGVAILAGETWRLGLAVLLAMVANLAVAGVAGALIPAVLRRLGRDPALGSSVIVAAAMDVCGLALLLAIATVVLR